MEDVRLVNGNVEEMLEVEVARLCKKAEVEEDVKAKNVKDPEWTWPTHEKWYSRLEGVWMTKETTNLDKGKKQDDGLECPFEVTTLFKDSNEDLSEVEIKLRSPYLIAIVRKYSPQVVKTFCCEEPSINVKDLFSIREDLQHELKILVQDGCNRNDESPQDESDSVSAESKASQVAGNFYYSGGGNIMDNTMKSMPSPRSRRAGLLKTGL